MSIYIDNKFTRLVSGRLRNFKQKRDDLFNFSCPFCGDSQKNKLKARGYVYRKGSNLFYSCHNCNISTTLGKLLERVDPTLYEEYIMERYVEKDNNKVNVSKQIVVPQVKFNKVEKKSFEYAELCSDLSDDNVCKKYIKDTRKIPPEFYGKLLYTKRYKDFVESLVKLDPEKEILNDERLVIPFFDEYGEIIAVSGRALSKTTEKLRYVTVRIKESTEKLIYGLERVDKSKKVKIVEGPVDSLFLSNCVASGDSNLSITAKKLAAKDMVLVFDNESRNKEIVKMIKTAIDNNFKVVIWPETIKEKDINDMIISGMTADTIEKIIEDNTFSGLDALAKLTFWKRV